MRSRVGTTAGLSLRGNMAVRTIVAAGAFLRHETDDRLQPSSNVGDLGVVAGLLPDVVGAGEQYDDLRVDAVQLAVLEPPEDVLRAVPAPAEVAGVPAVEGLRPVGQEVRIVEGAPAARDGVAEEIDVDAPALRLGEKLLMGDVGVRVGAHPGLVRRGRRWLVVQQPIRPGDEEAHVRPILVPAVVLAPCQLAFEKARVVGRHLRAPVVLGHADVAGSEQAEDRSGRDRGHEAPLLVEPVRVALLRDAVADERGTWRAQGDELVGVHRYVARVLAAEGRLPRRRTSGSCRPSSGTRRSPSGSPPPRRSCGGAAWCRLHRTIPRGRRRSGARTPS